MQGNPFPAAEDRPAVSTAAALLRASAYGNLAVLLPMVSSVAQVRQVKEMLAACRRELAGKQIPFSDKLEVGVLIETPAAGAFERAAGQRSGFLFHWDERSHPVYTGCGPAGQQPAGAL